jgi:hypothetical protein
MARLVREFLKDEEHASKVLIKGSVALMAVGLIVAACAIFFMK